MSVHILTLFVLTFSTKLVEYIKGTPTSTQTEDQVKAFLQQIDRYSLTLGEKVQVLNLRPKSAVEIYLVRLITLRLYKQVL